MLYDPKWEEKIEVKLEPWQQVMLKAIDVIERYGWVQNSYGSVERGFCIIGAISHAVPETYPERIGDVVFRRDLIHAATAEFYQAMRVIPASYNDYCLRTKQDVIETMRKVANHAV